MTTTPSSKETAMRKLVIVAAGQGKRLSARTQHQHKALLSLGNQAVISHIIAKFPKEMPIVVALGYLGAQLRDYLMLAHPERVFEFVEVENYDGPLSGPGTSLLACRALLSGPFYFTTVDTLIKNDIPLERLENWMGVARVDDSSSFCCVETEAGTRIVALQDKKAQLKNPQAFIGLAYIHSSQVFFESLSQDKTVIAQEIQVSNGFNGLITRDSVHACTFDWIDTGTVSGYDAAKTYFNRDQFDFSKEDETTYIVNDRIVKWFRDPAVASQRAARQQQLGRCVPPFLAERPQMLAYQKVPGRTLYEAMAEDKFKVAHMHSLWQWLHDALWQKDYSLQPAVISQVCTAFYCHKTLARLRQFFSTRDLVDDARRINGRMVLPIESLLSQIDWSNFAQQANMGQFHGDLQFDNILMVDALPAHASKQPFVLIDWRQDFAGGFVGDRYYDLAKLYGGLTLNYFKIKQGVPLFLQADAAFKEIQLEAEPDSSLREFKQSFESLCLQAGYSLAHIQLITALIYLNMAPLHAAPFDRYLLAYGQERLQSVLQPLMSAV